MAGEDRVVVVGAGISGLSTARALEQGGVPVTVLERATELPAFGGAITIWFNGVAALDRLGVADAVEAAGATLEFQSMRSWRDRTLFEIPVGELCRSNGLRPPIIVRRPDLVHALGSSLGDGVVRFGVTCTGFEEDGDGVTVRLDDGTTERAARADRRRRDRFGSSILALPGGAAAVRGLPVPAGGPGVRGRARPVGELRLHVRPRRSLRDQRRQ